ncbi:MAG: hypothetical protein MZU97_17525 [Bacillus subtilis]|nr:hypothetical protein [Bacillus subtilis]
MEYYSELLPHQKLGKIQRDSHQLREPLRRRWNQRRALAEERRHRRLDGFGFRLGHRSFRHHYHQQRHQTP